MTNQPDDRQPQVVATDPIMSDPSAENARHLDVDRAKGMAIALVVWGHLASVIAIQSPVWFLISITVVYSFHMPLFMYLSGFVYFLKNYQDRFWGSPVQYTASRFDRLMIPFIFFGLIVVLGKYTLNGIAPIPDPVNSIESGLLSVFTNAPGNPSASIWYLIVLFSYTIIAPFLWKIGKGSLVLIFILSIIGQLFVFTEDFYVDRIFSYLIFFVVGGYVAFNKERLFPIFKSYYLVFASIFLAICAFFFDHERGLLLCGLASLPAIHGLFLQDFWKGDRLFLLLGKSSMAIYLLNTIVLGLCGITLSYFSPGREYDFLPYAIVVFLFGLIMPIICRHVLSSINFMRPIFRYMQ